jgi:chemotaxis signal transduction protein
VTPRAGRYITFRIARLDFAIRADCVRGILPLKEMNPATGFAILNGGCFPVLDLRAKLRLPHATQGPAPYILAVEVESRLVGFIVDRVCGVVKARERDFRSGKLCVSGRPRELLDPKFLVGRAILPAAGL